MDGLSNIIVVNKLQAVHVFCKLRLEVGCLVLVYYIVLGKPVKHGNNFRVLLSCGFFIGCFAKFLHRGPCGPCVILVTNTL